MQLPVLAHGREGLLLDAGRAQLDALEHAGVEDVDAGVDPVPDELDRLLHEAVDAAVVVRLVHHDAVLGRLFHLRDDDRPFVLVRFVESGERFEGIVADDVRVEDEEGGGVLAECFGGKLQGAGSTKRLGLDAEFDIDAILFFVLEMALVSSGVSVRACGGRKRKGEGV